MSPLHIKLGLIKNFVKSMTKHRSNRFRFFCKKFPKLSQAKLSNEIFVGPQIRDFMKTIQFKKALTLIYLRGSPQRTL